MHHRRPTCTLWALLPCALLACSSENQVVGSAPTGATPGADQGDGADGGADEGDTARPDSDDTGDALPTEYVIEDDEPPPLLSLPEVEQSLVEVVAAFRNWRPFLVYEAHAAMLADGDGACPIPYDYYYPTYGYYYYYGSCAAESGLTYDGYIYGITYGTEFDTASYVYDHYAWWYGEGAARLSDDQRFDMSGYFYTYNYRYLDTEISTVYLSFTGEALWTGDTYGDTWLGEARSLSLTVLGNGAPGQGAAISLEGGMSGLSTPHTDTVRFEGLYMATEAWGSDCPIEPSGTVSVRDSAGEWYAVRFDGPAHAGAESFPPKCDGCGEVWYRGASLGTVCPDLSALTSWERNPW